ncbi:hypothetical protein ACLQ17_27060 [Streptomyces sp. DT197]|uniref:hypothetical protein n=1 Tax=Streptomyces sp. DT197 TaxID=3393417 RepID=UPI0036FEC7F6
MGAGGPGRRRPRVPPGRHPYRTGLANLVDLGLGTTAPVGSFPGGASPYGVLDLAGNADEARCARRHGAYERDLTAIGVGLRLAADADTP